MMVEVEDLASAARGGGGGGARGKGRRWLPVRARRQPEPAKQ